MISRPTRLRLPQTEKFDADNPDHRTAYVMFLSTQKWPINFEVEWPFTSIPSMVMFKLAAKAVEADGHLDLDTILQKSAIEPPTQGSATVPKSPRITLVA